MRREYGRTAAFTGIAGGFFSGLSGVGGGAIMVPLLRRMGGLTQHQAHGTSLAIVCFIGAAGAVSYGLHGNIDWSSALWLSIGGPLGALFGAATMNRLAPRPLQLIFGVFLITVAARMFIGAQMLDAITALITGLVGGFAGGMLGVGGGAIYVPSLVILLDVEQHSAQGASLVAIVPTAIFGSMTHVRNANVDVPLVVRVAPLAIVAGFIAGFVANSLDPATLQRIFGVVMAYLAVTTIIGALRNDATLEPQQGG